MVHMMRLRGAETVIVGLQAAAADAMTQLGLRLEDVTGRARPRQRAGALRAQD